METIQWNATEKYKAYTLIYLKNYWRGRYFEKPFTFYRLKGRFWVEKEKSSYLISGKEDRKKNWLNFWITKC